MFENIDIRLIKKELRDQSKNYKQNFINIEQFIKNEIQEILNLKKNNKPIIPEQLDLDLPPFLRNSAQ